MKNEMYLISQAVDVLIKSATHMCQRRIKVTSLAGEKVHPLRCARSVSHTHLTLPTNREV